MALYTVRAMTIGRKIASSVFVFDSNQNTRYTFSHKVYLTTISRMRPRDEKRTAYVTIRMTPRLKKYLQIQSDKHYRTLSQEIEMRVLSTVKLRK